MNPSPAFFVGVALVPENPRLATRLWKTVWRAHTLDG
jgi:hypothetical protein